MPTPYSYHNFALALDEVVDDPTPWCSCPDCVDVREAARRDTVPQPDTTAPPSPWETWQDQSTATGFPPPDDDPGTGWRPRRDDIGDLRPRAYCLDCDRFTYVNEGLGVCVDCFPMAEQRAAEREAARLRREEMRMAAEQRARAAESAQRKEARRRIHRNGRRIGIELEVSTELEADELAGMLSDAGVETESPGYTHAVLDCWKVVSDASVNDGWEIVSPPMTMERAKREVPIVCEVLIENDAQATRDCGLHVHHEVGDLSIAAFKRLVHRWANAQHHFDKIVARHRSTEYDCDWAGALRPRELAAIDRLASMSDLNECYLDRYKSLNVTSYSKYGTVEARQYQSTLDADEILAWARLGQAFIEDAIKSRTHDRGCVSAPNVETFLQRIVDQRTSRALGVAA